MGDEGFESEGSKGICATQSHQPTVETKIRDLKDLKDF
jgi:hypothetical protein